ncbi:MAG: exosortase/archaeosortase family protein [Armatimonadetes bacterium]|nr:exosortase/archaeosortase family protein [Armatimonadota bacterium]
MPRFLDTPLSGNRPAGPAEHARLAPRGAASVTVVECKAEWALAASGGRAVHCRRVPMSVSQESDQSHRLAGSSVWGQAGVMVGLLAVVFGPTWAWAVGIWRESEYYGHGFLIIPISGYLAWRLYRTRPAASGATWPGLLVMSAGLILHVVGRLLDVWFPSGFGFVAALAGLVWWLWGGKTARHFWFPIAYLAFAVPLERILVLQLAQPLQLGSSAAAAFFLKSTGLPVEHAGTTLRVPDYTFEVAVPCSGLKTAIAMTALSALVGYLLTGAPLARVMVFLAGVPVALVANAVRIVVVLVLASTVSPAVAEGFFHTASGLLVFALGFGGLLVVARLLGCRGIRSDI